uniref:Receptor accessory protein 4 n=1 Tax=Laticauda laticaudata TaxID=8630 RepID=A0A8C5RSG0_LATLA
MVAWALSRAVQLLLGTLYPAYASYKAVRNKDVREYVRWMMYWIVFALFMATETVTDTFVSWFPFYYEIKMAFVVWLLSPYTKGASLLYRKFVHPTLSSKEKEIDHFICQAKERGYESLVSFGKRSMNVAATVAVQGQGALAGRLRSFSMQDLRSMPETAMVHYSDPLYLEEQQLCRRPIGRRPAVQQPGSDSDEEGEDYWSDSELSAPSRGSRKDPALPKPLARSQSLRQGKQHKQLPAQEDEVLLTQEAKAECYGSWYLPAGRMEPRETVAEAVRREVQEETGLQCRPLTLLAVEERGPSWIRFVFLARPTGGTLKSLQQADAESLQARWWDRESPALPLRSRDILPLMDLALRYRAGPRHPPVLPAELPCASVCQRFLLVFTGGRDGSLWVLLETTGGPHLPLAASSPSASKPGERLVAALAQLLQRCGARPEVAVRLQGLLGLQHLGQDPGRSDGVCLNVVATVGSEERAPPALREPAFTWWEVGEAALKSQVLHRLRTASFLPMCS